MNFTGKAKLNAVQTAGNTEKFFDDTKGIIAANDGKRFCSMELANCENVAAPQTFDQKTEIRITSAQLMVSNIRKGFINAHLRIPVRIAGLTKPPVAPSVDGFTDGDHLGKVFIGYRSSRQAIENMTLCHRGVPTRYQNKYVAFEGFADAALSPWSCRDKKRFTETLYENVRQYLPDVAGTYVNLVDFADGEFHDVDIEVNIPLVDFLGFQSFSKWLGREQDFGELRLQIYFAITNVVLVYAK